MPLLGPVLALGSSWPWIPSLPLCFPDPILPYHLDNLPSFLPGCWWFWLTQAQQVLLA